MTSARATLARSSIDGASMLMSSAVAQRLISFLLNAALLRYVSADVVGFAMSDMELYLSTILFLSRESVRLFTSRFRAKLLMVDVTGVSEGALEREAFVRYAWLPLPIGLLLLLLLLAASVGYKLYNGDVIEIFLTPSLLSSDEGKSIFIYTCSIAFELLSEPWFNIANNFILYGLRARAELTGMSLKALVTFAFVFLLPSRSSPDGSPEMVLRGEGEVAALANEWGPKVAYSLGQLAFASTLLIMYVHGVYTCDDVAGAPRTAKVAPSPTDPEDSAHALPAAAKSTKGEFKRVSTFFPDFWGSSKSQIPSSASSSAADSATTKSDDTIALFLGFSLQGIVKHALTEGDRILLSLLASREQRGAYAVIVNYGSLPARFVFQPMEESLRNFVGKLFSAADAATASVALGTVDRPKSPAMPTKRRLSASKLKAASNTATPGPSERNTSDNVELADNTVSSQDGISDAAFAVGYLDAALRIVTFIGLTIAAFGAGYAPLATRFIFGKKWVGTELPSSLAAYCFYLPFMALNGVTEAFSVAIADSSRLHNANWQMLAFFLTFAAAVYFLLPVFGLSGIIFANCINMALRVISNTGYISNYMAQKKHVWTFAQNLFGTPLLIAFVGIFGGGLCSNFVWHSAIQAFEGEGRIMTLRELVSATPTLLHASLGALSLAAFVAVLWRYELSTLMASQRMLRGKQTKAA